MSVSTASEGQDRKAADSLNASGLDSGASFLDRRLRRAVLDKFAKLTEGEIVLDDRGETLVFGEPGEPPLRGSVRVNSRRFFRRLVAGGALGAAEAFLDGDWSSDDLTQVIRVFARNLAAARGLESGAVRPLLMISRLAHRLRKNTRRGGRRNIAAHYDLGDEFFEIFLDETMTYSCGVFDEDRLDMESASIEKYDRICRKLELKPSDHVLEIGCGWGGFALHAAGRYGCRVTGATISARQFETATRRVAEAGLSDRVSIISKDYRDIEGIFDKAVSIEMVEAVGHRYLETYFRACSDRLKPDGLFLLQAITIPDRLYPEYRDSVDFIQKYIFPGGCLVSLSWALKGIARSTDLALDHLETMPEHYARTLATWRDSFLDRIEKVRALGFDDKFIRAWLYYLSYCEAGFLERQISVAQILFSKPMARRSAILPRLG